MNGLSPYIHGQIVAGQAVLFLGAGASIHAQGKNGSHGLSSNALRDKLSEKFLGNESKTKPLNYVAERSTSIAGVANVHRFLKELFADLQPTSGHKLIPSLRWKGIVSTNYDLLVERAFERSDNTHQSLERIIWDRDDFSCLSKNEVVPYLKIHGCINRLNDPELPLVISSHDYYKFKTNRSSLVNTLREWGKAHPIIFCGYGIADENVKEILYDLTDPYLQRPQYVIVDPHLEDGDISYWKGVRFDCIRSSFDDFMRDINASIPQSNVVLASVPASSLSITRLIPSHATPSMGLVNYLGNGLEHLFAAYTTPRVAPRDFYRGNSHGFAWVTDDFDARRRVIDTLLEDIVLNAGKNSQKRPYLYVLSGYAGSGKSVALKRFGWESAVQFDSSVFYIGEGVDIKVAELLELARLIESRIYVVVDDILVNRQGIEILIAEARKAGLAITIIGGVRPNEWNVSGASLETELDAEYELMDLGHEEILKLIKKLSDNKCLGYLDHLPESERASYFQDKLQSQLLVALHETTEGKSFEEIVSDEFQKIAPVEAKTLYLDVCTLDRFNVGVRAGLMSRISGVTFDEFSKRLLSPLEQVVHVRFDHRSGDYVYRSRHQNIAELVFEAALDSQDKRATQIVRILRYLNGAYEADRIALTILVKGRALATQFSDKKYVAQVFEAALESGLHPSIVAHQMAVFELHHPNGDLRAALLKIGSIEQNPGPLSGRTVSHTKANILRRLAQVAKTELEKSRFRQDALAILNISIRTARDALPFLTRGQLLLEQLKEKMETTEIDSEVDSRVVVELTKEIETNLRLGLQHFPNDEKLLSFEADLSTFLENTPRAIRALEQAYSANKDSVYTAIRLARHYAKSVEKQAEALAMMRKLSSDQPLSREAHFELARMLKTLDEVGNQSEIGQHLKRSFSQGDSHFEARFMYARHQFLYSSSSSAKQEYSALSKIPLSPSIMNEVRAEIKDNTGRPVWNDGTIKSVHESFAFISCAAFQDNIFVHFKVFQQAEQWESLRVGSRVSFTLGFSFKGPKAKRISLVR